MNVFEAVKDNVTARQAAEAYGIRINRNGMAVCPFHNDKNPSMKVDRRFHCFGCQADGDVIDFAARLFGLSSKEAAHKLAADFSVNYEGRGHDPPQRRSIRRQLSEMQKLKQAEKHGYRVLSEYYHLLRQWRTEYAPQPGDTDWHPLFVEALQKTSYVEYLLDTLLSGTWEERADLLVKMKKEVARIERRISGFAASHPAGRGERSGYARTGTDGR